MRRSVCVLLAALFTPRLPASTEAAPAMAFEGVVCPRCDDIVPPVLRAAHLRTFTHEPAGRPGACDPTCVFKATKEKVTVTLSCEEDLPSQLWKRKGAPPKMVEPVAYSAEAAAMKIRASILTALASVSIGCSSLPDGDGADRVVTVELDVFSGEPNPQWTLSHEEKRELRLRLVGLPLANGAFPPEGRLGYRGFYLLDPGVIAARVGVGSGLVFDASSDRKARVYRDTNHLERWLQDQARRRGLEHLVKESR